MGRKHLSKPLPPGDSSHEGHARGRTISAEQVRRGTNARACCFGDSFIVNRQSSDCEFTYGDFRDAATEDFGAHKFEGFLVAASSKGDTLSLFEMKR